MINTAINSSIEIISKHGFAEILQNTLTHQKSLHALVSFAKDDMLCEFKAGNTYSQPNYLTVQTGINVHITLMPVFLQYINHSCSPNVFFDTRAMKLIALKNIEPNEELTFFYPSAEYNMAQPFICFCGSKNCLQNIKGAKYISPEVLKQYRLTDFILEEMKLKH